MLHEQYQGDDFYFQQDGAPQHFALNVRELLESEFPLRWIGRRGAIEWPPRSPNLTPMDFFFRGFVKDKVFARKPRTVENMIHFIIEACEEIDDDKDLFLRVCMSVSSRLQQCIYKSINILNNNSRYWNGQKFLNYLYRFTIG